MLETIVRMTKGVLMGVLYGLFFLGILCEIFLFLPGISFLNRLFGQQPYRMQWALRILLNLWLRFLWACRLLVSMPAKGKPLAAFFILFITVKMDCADYLNVC